MKLLNLVQGSQEWHANRARHFNASDAPAMLGVSPYKTRAQLVREIATGLREEIEDGLQRIFDDGHRFESLARAVAEKIIGEELYPCVGTDGLYSASFDGLTMMQDVGFEHKTLNDDLRAAMLEGCTGADLPLLYQVQMEHQAMVSGAERVLFMASKWDVKNALVEERHCWYSPNPELRSRIVAGWAQFQSDLAAYVPQEEVHTAVGRIPDSLPALRIEVTGMVTASNLTEFRDHAIAVFKGISTDLKTDQDFSDAEQTIKWCSNIEDRLVAAKQHALSQTESIDALFRAIDSISAEARAKRLELDKLVKVRKESIRADIVEGGYKSVLEHYKTINTTMGKHAIQMPQSLRAELAAAIKGKKTITSIRDAVDTAVASAKIDASGRSEHVRTMVAALDELSAGYETLFPDAVSLCASKNIDDLRNLVAIRISEHKAREEAKIKAEKDKAERLVPVSTVNPADVTEPIACATPLPTAGRVKLSDINAALYPLSITPEGLAMIGFQPVGSERAAKLYAANDLPKILLKLSHMLFDYVKKIEEQPQQVA